jgi:hypothetical protein
MTRFLTTGMARRAPRNHNPGRRTTWKAFARMRRVNRTRALFIFFRRDFITSTTPRRATARNARRSERS